MRAMNIYHRRLYTFYSCKNKKTGNEELTNENAPNSRLLETGPYDEGGGCKKKEEGEVKMRAEDFR